MGDPAGIAPEITALAWQYLHDKGQPFFLIAEPDIYRGVLAQMNLPDVQQINEPADCQSIFAQGLPVLPIALAKPAIPGQPITENGPAIVQSIKLAVEFCKTGQASAIVTNPIAKSVLYQSGFTHPGHTEFLGALATDFTQWSAPKGPVMMLCGGGLRVALVSVHCSLAEVPAQITTNRVSSVIKVVQQALQQDFGITKPRIALCGLNPHAGEDGAMGLEERDILNPLAQNLRAQGINITDALPADTLFRDELRSQYDGVIAMYHDQGLIPVKTLDFHRGTNVTLGLPFVRVSPDHGTGFDIAGTGQARPDSLIAALQLAGQIAQTRNQQP
ncbi:4-hydroxythreonine-4-phosphate dehydrogenase [hydrothermal vent metagenome]|uniref:4-hydroxythreonine-4-phosphate dehydrogenase n=1 Tax=hydrothermal vent metagenome TaxID=652676 RepID=A0A3B0RJ04_9ZZZZ